MADAETALAMVQKCDPPGTSGAHGLLRVPRSLQLTPDVPCREVLHVLISQHLEDIQQNRLPTIEKKTGIPMETIKDAIEHLRQHLNPRPGSRFMPPRTPSSSSPTSSSRPTSTKASTRSGSRTTTRPQLSISALTIRSSSRTRAPTRRPASSSRRRSSRPCAWLIESIEQRP